MALVLTRRLQPVRGLVDLVPAVTVILLLLCFFLLSSSFVLQPGINVDMPRLLSSYGVPSSRLIVAVALAPQQFDPAGKPLPRDPVLYYNDQIVTLEGLHDALDRIPAGPIPPLLVIKADKDVPFSAMTGIIDVVHGRFPVSIATRPTDGATP